VLVCSARRADAGMVRRGSTGCVRPARGFRQRAAVWTTRMAAPVRICAASSTLRVSHLLGDPLHLPPTGWPTSAHKKPAGSPTRRFRPSTRGRPARLGLAKDMHHIPGWIGARHDRCEPVSDATEVSRRVGRATAGGTGSAGWETMSPGSCTDGLWRLRSHRARINSREIREVSLGKRQRGEVGRV
jgi:hypothetical protein